MVKNKKAWLRIVEASIAILIVVGVVLIMMSGRGVDRDISDEVYQRQEEILNVILNNNSFRNDILDGNSNKINNEILRLVPFSWDFSVNICNVDEVCPNPQLVQEEEVYITERIVSSTISQYSPKKIRFFIWIK